MLEGVLLYRVGFSTLLEEDALFSVQGGMTDWKLCLGWALLLLKITVESPGSLFNSAISMLKGKHVNCTEELG